MKQTKSYIDCKQGLIHFGAFYSIGSFKKRGKKRLDSAKSGMQRYEKSENGKRLDPSNVK